MIVDAEREKYEMDSSILKLSSKIDKEN